MKTEKSDCKADFFSESSLVLMTNRNSLSKYGACDFCFYSKYGDFCILFSFQKKVLCYSHWVLFCFFFSVSTVQRFGKRKALVGIDQGKKWHSFFLGFVLKIQISLYVAS